jgi:hypothetical protein
MVISIEGGFDRRPLNGNDCRAWMSRTGSCRRCSKEQHRLRAVNGDDAILFNSGERGKLLASLPPLPWPKLAEGGALRAKKPDAN